MMMRQHSSSSIHIIIQVLEEIDDDLDQFGIMFVKIDDEKEADEYGIDTLPAIGNLERVKGSW